jgi:hypothetical protein
VELYTPLAVEFDSNFNKCVFVAFIADVSKAEINAFLTSVNHCNGESFSVH